MQIDSRKYSKKGLQSPAGLGKAVNIKKKKKEACIIIYINRLCWISKSKKPNHSNCGGQSSTISHIIHLCRIPFILYFGGKKIAWKITLSDRRLRIPQLRFTKQQRSLSIHEITDGCNQKPACRPTRPWGDQPPQFHLFTCAETHGRNWGKW